MNVALTGVDISSKMLERADEGSCYDSLLNLDINQELPFLADSYDYIVCAGVTNHLKGIRICLAIVVLSMKSIHHL